MHVCCPTRALATTTATHTLCTPPVDDAEAAADEEDGALDVDALEDEAFDFAEDEGLVEDEEACLER